jgi:hypothetical protein
MRSEAKHIGKMEKTKIVCKKILENPFIILAILIFICMPSCNDDAKRIWISISIIFPTGGVEANHTSTPLFKYRRFYFSPDSSVSQAWPSSPGWQIATCSAEQSLGSPFKFSGWVQPDLL